MVDALVYYIFISTWRSLVFAQVLLSLYFDLIGMVPSDWSVTGTA